MALGAGSIAFTGFNGDGNDNLSFVALTDIAAGTVINFTDTNWNGTSFASGSSAESTIAWTGTTAIAAGTVIDINNIGKGTLGVSAGSASFTNSTNTGLSNDSEVVYAYVGSSSAPTFLAAISNVGYSTSDGTLTGTGLVAGQTAVSFTGGLDIVGYNGARSGQADYASYLALINNAANWLTQDGSGDQSADGTQPNAPFPTTAFTVAAPASQTIAFSPSSVSVAEGDSGTKIMTFTVTRTGGTTGAVSFSGTFNAGTTNAADFGGALPASTFSGTIADGANSATVTITISGDTTGEPDESFSLTLTSVSNASAAVTIGTATATGTITNDDGTVVSANSSSAITLVNNDHLTVLSGVTLSGATPVTWNGGSTSPGVNVDNFGTITGTTRGIDTTKNAVSGSFTLHNEAGATISASDDALKIRNLVAGTTGTVTIINDGTITSATGQALDLDAVASSGVSTVITNSATGLIQSGDADAIRPGTNATINNYGQIISHNASSASTGNDAIDFQAVNTGGVVNNFAGGQIIGARHGVTGDQPITVNNTGTITGQAGSGINMDSAANTTTTVTNSGTIIGTSVNGADADGIDVDGLVAIDNSGTIKAVGLTTGDSLNEALAIGGGTVINRAGGLIVSDQRAITVDDSNNGNAFGATTIVNEGTIQGNNGEAISITDTFADTITNKGTIVGSVAMGGGDDTFNAYAGSTVSGPVDGGAGTDTLNLLGSGTGRLGANTGFEKLDVQSGVWMVDSAAYRNIHIAANATVTSHLALAEQGTLTVDIDGSLVVAGTALAAAGSATIENSGSIGGLGLPGADGIVLAGGTIHNHASGIILGQNHAIESGDGLGGGAAAGVTIVNDGLIQGLNGEAIELVGTQNDTLTNNAMILGSVDLGGGDDTLNVAAGALFDSAIIGGDGNDTVNLIGAGSGTLGATSGFENLDVKAGSWTIANSENYSDIKVEQGASVTSQIILSGNDHLTVAAGGSVVVDSDTAVLFSGAATGVVIDNAGTISSKDGGYAIGVSFGANTHNVTIINEATGVLTGQQGALRFNSSTGSAGVVVLDNGGLIDGGNSYAVNWKDLAATSITITNRAGGVISNEGLSDVLRPGNQAGTTIVVNNDGTIINNPDADGESGGDAIDFQSSSTGVAGTVNNGSTGIINGGGHGITGKGPVIVTNAAGGQIIGRNGSAVNIDNNASAAATVYVTNHGDMLGESANTDDSDGDAVDVDGLLKLDNTGNIKGLGANGTHDGGANVSEGVAIGGGVINNYAGGMIYGYGRAIQVDDSNNGAALGATTIYNEGTIQGDGHGPQNFEPGSDAGIVIDGREAIDILGTFADTITNKGQIIGGVFTDGGDDTFNAYAGSSVTGPIDLGAGNDTVNLLGMGTGSLGTVVNAENLNVKSGTWSFDDSAQAFTTIDISGGATVAGSVLLDGTDRLIVEAGGRIDGGVGWVSNNSNVVVDNAGTITGLSSDYITTKASIAITNEATGTIAHGMTIYGNLNGGSVTVDNYGSIVGDPNVSYMAMKFEDLTGGAAKIINHAGGLIAAAAFQDTIRAGATTTVENAGTIQSYADNAATGWYGGDAIDFRSNNGGVVHNLAGGLIEGSHHGVTGKKGITVVNDAGGTIIGRNGSAVNFDNNASVDNIVYVTNHGTLQGKSAGYADSDGDAIDADGLLHLDNDGTIQGLGANGYHNGEVNVSEGVAAGGGVINNYAGGTIYGYGRAIQVDNSSNGPALGATTIYNEGLIQGDGHGPAGVAAADAAAMQAKIDGREAIDILGSFADTITNKGQIVGGVFTDGGDDTFNAYTGSSVTGPIDLGAGNDTVNLLGTGTGSFGSAVNAENLNVVSGTWSIADSQNYSRIEAASGATVNGPLLVNGTDVLIVDAGGAVIGSNNNNAIVWTGAANGAVVNNNGSVTADIDGWPIAAFSNIDSSGLTPGSGSLTLNNNTGAVLGGVFLDGDLGDAGAFTLNNAGTIVHNYFSTDVSGDYLIDIEDTGLGQVTINNLAGGVIQNPGDGDLIHLQNATNAIITNAGTIRQLPDLPNDSQTKGVYSAISYKDSTGVTVANLTGGLIEGSKHGVTGSAGVTVVNQAGATIIGRNGSAVNIDNNPVVETTVYVTNYGTLQGKSAGYSDSDGDAIDADGFAVIDNYGLVQGLGARGLHKGEANVSEGIAIGGGTINNFAGGTIYGYGRAIQVDDSSNGGAYSSTIIYNEGLIQGDGHGPEGVTAAVAAAMQAKINGREAIDILGSFADTITNKGQIVGGVFTDGGDDTFNAYTGSSVTGPIDLGAGNDTVNLLGSGAGSFGTAVNAEKLVVQGGTWSIANTANYADIDIKGGATVTSQIVLSGSDRLTVEAGGTVSGAVPVLWNGGSTTTIVNAGHITATSRGIDTGSTAVSGDLNIVNQAGGEIIATADAIRIQSLNGTATGKVTIDNAGTIRALTGGEALDLKKSTSVNASFEITNEATGVIESQASEAIVFGHHTTLYNYGQILGTADTMTYSGIDIDKFTDALIYNYAGALISGGHHGITGDAATTIVNDGTIIGNNGSGINLDTSGTSVTTVTNTGAIIGTALNGDGDAIDVDGQLALTNSGTIKALLAFDGETNEALAIGGGTIKNLAGGLIYSDQRAIEVDDSNAGAAYAAVTIVNDGTIQGAGGEAIRILGTFADSLTNHGTILGSVSMGGGDDTLTNTGSITVASGAAIDMGDGNDTVILGAGSVVTGTIVLGAGDDTLTATASASAVTVDAGAGNDHVVGSTMADTIDGGAGDDALIGGGGADRLTGGSGNDLIEGDQGNDTLTGGDGSDTYRYAAGDGSDLIVEGAGEAGDSDTLALTNLNFADVTLYRHGSDLQVVMADGSVVTVQAQFANGGVENIVFGDGTVLDRSGILADLVDHAPVAGDVTLPTVTEDAPAFTISFADLLANASDADLDALTVSAISHVTGGTAEITADGIRFTLDANYNGTVSFSFTVDDGRGGTVAANASFAVTPVDDAPIVVTPAAVTTAEDTPVTGQIVATEVDGEHLTYAIKGDGAAHGVVSIDASGHWSYAPAADYNGTDSFTVEVSDGHTTVETTVALTVTPVNDAPVIVTPAAVTTAEDTPVTGHIVASDVDGDVLSYAIKGGGAGHGIVTIDDHGNWSYAPAANYNGSDSFIVSVSDGHVTTDSIVSLTINPVNDAPVAVADAATVGENDSALFNLTANDTDVEDGKPTLSSFHVTGVDGIALSNDAVSSAFSIVNGELQFNPGSLFDSLNDGQHATVTISYTAEDSGHAQATGQFVLTINGETDANVINGTDQADLLIGGGGPDKILAGDGDDTIYTGDGNDIVDAGKGNDFVFAGNGVKTIDGGDGDDYLFGGSGNSTINGGNGNDLIMGGSGNETLNGGAGNDLIYAGSGNDTLSGGAGNDLLYGGAGQNTFVFAQGDGHDTVLSFQASGASHDLIQIDAHEFASFAALAQSSAFADTAAGAQITYHDGSTMTFTGIHKADLTVDDFRFA